MKYILLLLAVTILTSEKCKKKNKGSHQGKEIVEVITNSKDSNTVPVCVQHKIDSIKKEPRWNPPAQVDEYVYNDKHVFLFSADCCDFFNMLYDSSCKNICAPSGGITGRGDGKCAAFSKTARYVKLVWKDPR